MKNKLRTLKNLSGKKIKKSPVTLKTGFLKGHGNKTRSR